ncbi:MAG: PD-(D/E)XK motif protein, partial [Lysobacteraceae bacterium]
CGAVQTVRASTSGTRLSVTLSRYDVAGRSTRFIDVMCRDRSLDTVFAELANEVLHRIDQGGGSIEAVEGTVADFRALLQGTPESAVADLDIAGLIGELVVLRILTGHSGDAVETWTGPFGQRHDFRRELHALEVKTSLRADSTSIFVSSVEQLAEPADGSLLLVHLNLEQAASGELAVSSLCDEIVRLGAERTRLVEALTAMGCSDPDSPAWNRIRFSLEKCSGYRVGPKFPRITAAQFPGHTLPEGIVSLTYKLDLRAAERFRVPDSELFDELGRVFR